MRTGQLALDSDNRSGEVPAVADAASIQCPHRPTDCYHSTRPEVAAEDPKAVASAVVYGPCA